jgi:exosome complex component RRP4
MDKKLVIPGDFLSDEEKLADEGTYVENGKVFSSVLGIASIKDRIRVVPFAGKYIPRSGDLIVGVVKEISFSNWIVDIRSPYDGLLHISEFPRRIDNVDMPKYLNIGDSIITIVRDVDEKMKVELTLNDQRLRTVKEGRIIEVTPFKVPRLIGRGGSMIAMLKNETGCHIFVGQNGRIWISGKDKGMDLAARAILKIERETHISGLTERITRFLKEEKGQKIIEKVPLIKKEKIEKTEEGPQELEEEIVEEEPHKKEEKTEQESQGGILDELLGNDK